MDCCAVVITLLVVTMLTWNEMVMSRYVPLSVVTETSDHAAVNVTDGAASPGIVNITSNDVERHLQQNDAIVIDVRNFNEVTEFGQIPSSQVLPVDDIESAMRLSSDEFKTKYGFVKPSPSGPPVIVYCRAGVRATAAAKTFADQFGFSSVLVYKGSWLDWAAQHPEHTKKPPE